MKPAALLRSLRRRATRLGLEHSERPAKGSHIFVWHDGRATVIAGHREDIAPGTFRAILRQLGLTLADLED